MEEEVVYSLVWSIFLRLVVDFPCSTQEDVTRDLAF